LKRASKISEKFLNWEKALVGLKKSKNGLKI
jgi:hypothetical protein